MFFLVCGTFGQTRPWSKPFVNVAAQTSARRSFSPGAAQHLLDPFLRTADGDFVFASVR
jgi:hypothetical protein